MRPFHIDRRMLKNLDWLLILCILVITIFSVVMVFSASLTVEEDPFYYLKRHPLFVLVGLAAFGFGMLLDYTFLQRFAKGIYGVMSASLLFVFAFGAAGKYGAYRWIDLGPVSIQPAEWAKICLILCLAALFDHYEEPHGIKPFLFGLGAMVLPAALVIVSDLGTSTVLIVITMGMMFLYGTPLRYLLVVVGSGLAALPFLWGRLASYQQERLTVFLDPKGNMKLDAGWQVFQSLVAIGSGGLWGAGYLQGAQTQLSFLPEKHTDFIFATIAEELGFFGAAILVVVYLVMIWRIFSIAQTSRDRYGQLVAGGIGFMLLYHLLVNIGMTLSVMPVTGIPLPLVSYGTNNLFATMLGLGIVTSIGLRRTKSIF